MATYILESPKIDGQRGGALVGKVDGRRGGALVGKVDQSGPRKITASKSVRWPMGGGASVGVHRGESTNFSMVMSEFCFSESIKRR